VSGPAKSGPAGYPRRSGSGSVGYPGLRQPERREEEREELTPGSELVPRTWFWGTRGY